MLERLKHSKHFCEPQSLPRRRRPNVAIAPPVNLCVTTAMNDDASIDTWHCIPLRAAADRPRRAVGQHHLVRNLRGDSNGY